MALARLRTEENMEIDFQYIKKLANYENLNSTLKKKGHRNGQQAQADQQHATCTGKAVLRLAYVKKTKNDPNDLNRRLVQCKI